MIGVELDGGQLGPWARGGEVAAVVVVSENTTVAPASLFFFFKHRIDQTNQDSPYSYYCLPTALVDGTHKKTPC